MEIARFMREEVKRELNKCIDEAQQYIHSISGEKLALIIDGKCLMYALDPSLRVILLNLSLNCSSVVCCRVSPLQKAQVWFLMESLLDQRFDEVLSLFRDKPDWLISIILIF